MISCDRINRIKTDKIERIFDELARGCEYRTESVRSLEAVLKPGDIKGKSVLDIGCGRGEAVVYCAGKGASYVGGIDISGENIAIARRRAAGMANVAFRRSSVEEYSPSRTFDMVLALGVFEYFEDPLQSLEKISGMLSADGAMILRLPKISAKKRASFLLRIFLSRMPASFAVRTARYFSRLFRISGLDQKIVEALMVPRYNVFDYKIFCDYLERRGYGVKVFDGISATMICVLARKTR